MIEEFRGEFNQKVDSKARVAIPALLRRGFEAGDPGWPASGRAKMIVVYGGGAARTFCEAYTLTGMKKLEARIAQMKLGSREREFMHHNIITRSMIVEIDDDGRIILPAKARLKLAQGPQEAQVGFECVLAGTGESVRIWNRAVYVERFGDDDEDRDEGIDLGEGADMMFMLPELTEA